MHTQPLTQVAVGMVYNPQGQVLFAQRPAGKPYAGWWEFPGGKLESGETTAQALSRELKEELGIVVTDCHHWLTQSFVYPHAHVNLQFCKVRSFTGTPQSLEGQAFCWGTPSQAPLPFLPAALPVLQAMQLPDVLRLTHAVSMGFEAWAQALIALQSGMVVLHEPATDAAAFERVLAACLTWRAQSKGGRTLLISSRHPQAAWGLADGVHFTERDLLTLHQRPSYGWVGTSVHSAPALAHAADLGLNYAALGTVRPSASHPRGAHLGWAAASEILANTRIATYALGGVRAIDLPYAFAAGAVGVAAKSSAWSPSTMAL